MTRKISKFAFEGTPITDEIAAYSFGFTRYTLGPSANAEDLAFTIDACRREGKKFDLAHLKDSPFLIWDLAAFTRQGKQMMVGPCAFDIGSAQKLGYCHIHPGRGSFLEICEGPLGDVQKFKVEHIFLAN